MPLLLLSFCSLESVFGLELVARASRPLTARSNAAAEAVDWSESCLFTEEVSALFWVCSFRGDGDLGCDMDALF